MGQVIANFSMGRVISVPSEKASQRTSHVLRRLLRCCPHDVPVLSRRSSYRRVIFIGLFEHPLIVHHVHEVNPLSGRVYRLLNIVNYQFVTLNADGLQMLGTQYLFHQQKLLQLMNYLYLVIRNLHQKYQFLMGMLLHQNCR